MANTPAVDQVLQMSRDLTGEATAYAGRGAYEPEMDSMLRQIQVAIGALQTALQSTAFIISQRPQSPVAPAVATVEPAKKK